jgi:hypothetical protein
MAYNLIIIKKKYCIFVTIFFEKIQEAIIERFKDK